MTKFLLNAVLTVLLVFILLLVLYLLIPFILLGLIIYLPYKLFRSVSRKEPEVFTVRSKQKKEVVQLDYFNNKFMTNGKFNS